jgi:hypothetical protein
MEVAATLIRTEEWKHDGETNRWVVCSELGTADSSTGGRISPGSCCRNIGIGYGSHPGVDIFCVVRPESWSVILGG